MVVWWNKYIPYNQILIAQVTFFLSSFFFWQHPPHVAVPRPGIQHDNAKSLNTSYQETPKVTFFSFFFLTYYSSFTMLCQFLLYSKVTHVYTFPFLCYLPSGSIQKWLKRHLVWSLISSVPVWVYFPFHSPPFTPVEPP